MKTRGLFWGVFLITLGVLGMGRNMGWFNFDWDTVTDLWPVLLILGGVTLILERRNSQWATIAVLLFALVIPFFLVGVFHSRHDSFDRYEWSDNDDDDNGNRAWDNNDDDDDDNNADDSDNDDDSDSDNTTVNTRSDKFVEAMSPDAQSARLKLEGGAARFTIGEPTTDLINAETQMTFGSYSMNVARDETTHTPSIELKPNEGNVNIKDGKLDNRVNVKLNATPVWDVEVDMGAGAGDFDLSSYAVSRLDLEAGAADVEVKLGDRADQTDVKISSGVASVVIRVPKSVGCKVENDGALNVNELDDLQKVADGSYLTPGYDSAKKKILIRYDGGMSRFKVVRY